MDKFPLTWKDGVVGELAVEQEPLYTRFEARCRLPEPGLWCAWAMGEQGELRLGVLEPWGDRLLIRRRFSQRITAPLGPLVKGEARPCGAPQETWEPVADPAQLFRTPWLHRAVLGAEGLLVSPGQQGGRSLAVPLDPKRPFLLPPLFCLAQVRTIRGRRYAVFGFDRQEQPLLPGDHGGAEKKRDWKKE